MVVFSSKEVGTFSSGASLNTLDSSQWAGPKATLKMKKMKSATLLHTDKAGPCVRFDPKIPHVEFRFLYHELACREFGNAVSLYHCMLTKIRLWIWTQSPLS